MNREEAHKLIDQLFDQQVGGVLSPALEGEQSLNIAAPEKPKDKRVIRTKSTGDRVYLIDEAAKTKAWVTSPEILEKLGFALSDVEDVDDKDLVGYAMTASVYRVED